jgi:hypothetical protein
LLLAVGAAAFFLLGAADSGDEVLSVEAAAYVSVYVSLYSTVGALFPVHICVAVTSPSRGVVDQLREGNIQVHDPIRGPDGPWEDEHRAIEVQGFSNLGGGFYLIEVVPWNNWEADQHVLRLEVECPWGRGITVLELPVMPAFFKYYRDTGFGG